MQHKQVKETEAFDQWTKIQQYILSPQGKVQVQQLGSLKTEDVCKWVSRVTLDFIYETVFKGAETNLDSPRVKQQDLKPCFCVAWFYIVLVITNDEIKHSVGQLIEGDFKKQEHPELVPDIKLSSKVVQKPIASKAKKVSVDRKADRKVSVDRKTSVDSAIKVTKPYPFLKRQSFMRETISTQIKKQNLSLHTLTMPLNTSQITTPAVNKSRHSRSRSGSCKSTTVRKITKTPLPKSPDQIDHLYGLKINGISSTVKKVSGQQEEPQVNIEDLIKRVQKCTNQVSIDCTE